MENDPSTTFHNRYITMFETVIYPMLVIAYLLNSGAYDLFVQGIQKCCIKDPTVENWEKIAKCPDISEQEYFRSEQ